MKKKKTIKEKAGKKKRPRTNKGPITIVKRRWHVEPFDSRKIYGSCYFACRTADLGEKEAENIADKVSKAAVKWLKKKKFISSDDIFKFLVKEIKKYDEGASYLFETHRDIS
jgi:transcriptional regulator NrdR family protein